MKVILLQHLSGAKTYAPGDSVEVSEKEASSMIKKGIAKLKTQNETNEFFAKITKDEESKAEAEAEAKAILEKEQLEAELNGLYNDVVLKEAELNGVILNGEQILEMVEELKKRVLPVNGNYFDLNSLGGDK